MLDNLSIGLDIATALSVIGAATAFIWNSISERKKEQKVRRTEIIKSHVFKAVDRIVEDSDAILKETSKIARKVQEGETTQNLNPWRDLILELPDSFKWLQPLDEVYGDGRYARLAVDFQKELDEFILEFHRFIMQEDKGEWDFNEVMKDPPQRITLKYVTRLYQETEDYFASI